MMLVKSVQDRDGVFVGLRQFQEYFQTPALRQSIGHTLAVAGDGDRDHDSAGIHVRLRADAQLHAAEGHVPRHRADADPGAVAAGRDLVHPVVRYAGPAQVDAGRRLGLWADRHHHQLDLCGVSACVDDHPDVAAAVRRAAVRGGGIARHADVAQVLYHHSARREVRSDQRGDGGFFLFRQRIRHPEGHRRQLQRARTRHLQAGHRPAELQQGRGRQHRCCWCRSWSRSSSTG